MAGLRLAALRRASCTFQIFNVTIDPGHASGKFGRSVGAVSSSVRQLASDQPSRSQVTLRCALYQGLLNRSAIGFFPLSIGGFLLERGEPQIWIEDASLVDIAADVHDSGAGSHLCRGQLSACANLAGSARLLAKMRSAGNHAGNLVARRGGGERDAARQASFDLGQQLTLCMTLGEDAAGVIAELREHSLKFGLGRADLREQIRALGCRYRGRRRWLMLDCRVAAYRLPELRSYNPEYKARSLRNG